MYPDLVSSLNFKPQSTPDSKSDWRQHLKEQLDGLISSQCLYCGDIMIKAVENLFIAPNEKESIQSWRI